MSDGAASVDRGIVRLAAPMTTPIRHVSDTALWVAMYRAFESERPDALFRDPHARRMAGERGEHIVRAIPRGRSLAWPMIVRTAVMDEIILRQVAHGVGTVREAEFRSVWLESQRLGRTMPLAWLWNALSRLRSRKTREAYQRMSGIVLLQRT